MSANQKRKWIIYMYTFPNGKRYIGKTSTSLKDRQGGANWVGYSHCTVLMKAIQKYGTDNIKQEILFEDEMTDEYSSRLEQMCILLFKTNCRRFKNPQYGYNTTDGGDGSIGHHHTEESKKKMSESKKGKTGKDANSSKAVYCIELDKIFVNGVEAEKCTGVDRKMISQALHSRKKNTSGGHTGFVVLHWIFVADKSIEFIDKVMHEPVIVFSVNTNSGVHGVCWDKSKNKWAATIRYCGKSYFLGRYVDKDDAIIARLLAEKQYYGDLAPQSSLFDKYNIEQKQKENANYGKYKECN